jgi:hypothetical protein
VATNNSFAPLRDLPMEYVGPAVKENALQDPKEMKVRATPIVLTTQANLIILQRELKSAVSGEFFRNTATGTRITTRSTVDYNAIQFPH